MIDPVFLSNLKDQKKYLTKKITKMFDACDH